MHNLKEISSSREDVAAQIKMGRSSKVRDKYAADQLDCKRNDAKVGESLHEEIEKYRNLLRVKTREKQSFKAKLAVLLKEAIKAKREKKLVEHLQTCCTITSSAASAEVGKKLGHFQTNCEIASLLGEPDLVELKEGIHLMKQAEEVFCTFKNELDKLENVAKALCSLRVLDDDSNTSWPLATMQHPDCK